MNCKRFVTTFLLIVLVSNLFGQHSTFIKAGLLYDSEQNMLLKNRLIHVNGNQIVNIGDFDELPESVDFIDLTDYTVLPGLIDAHTHVLFSQDADEDFAEHSIHSLTMESDGLRVLRGAKRAQSYLDVGITSIKDIGNSGLFLDVALRDAIAEGTVLGPRIFASGPILAASGGQIYGVSAKHQDLIDLEYRVIKSIEDARLAVQEHVNQNVDLIKVCADNIPNNTALSIDEMRAIVETAHSYNLTVTAHSITNQSAWNAVHAGVDGIEHGFNLADSTLKLMFEQDVYLVPTENSRDYMMTYCEYAGYDIEEIDWVDGYLDKMKDRLKRAMDAGVMIVAGSDNYTDIYASRGVSSSDMYRAYFEMGMKPLDILQSATYLSAVRINKGNEIGVIKSGAMADIIAVKGDIENDFIKTISNIQFVMKDGEVYMKIVK